MKEYIVINRNSMAECVDTKAYCMRYMLRSGKRAELTILEI